MSFDELSEIRVCPTWTAESMTRVSAHMVVHLMYSGVNHAMNRVRKSWRTYSPNTRCVVYRCRYTAPRYRTRWCVICGSVTKEAVVLTKIKIIVWCWPHCECVHQCLSSAMDSSSALFHLFTPFWRNTCKSHNQIDYHTWQAKPVSVVLSLDKPRMGWTWPASCEKQPCRMQRAVCLSPSVGVGIISSTPMTWSTHYAMGCTVIVNCCLLPIS